MLGRLSDWARGQVLAPPQSVHPSQALWLTRHHMREPPEPPVPLREVVPAAFHPPLVMAQPWSPWPQDQRLSLPDCFYHSGAQSALRG